MKERVARREARARGESAQTSVAGADAWPDDVSHMTHGKRGLQHVMFCLGLVG